MQNNKSLSVVSIVKCEIKNSLTTKQKRFEMTIQQQKPQLLPLLYETIQAAATTTTAAAATTTTTRTTYTQTTKATTILNNYNDKNSSSNNFTTSTYKVVHMSKNTTNVLPQASFLYSPPSAPSSSSSVSSSSSLEKSSLSSSSSSTSVVADIVESLTSLDNISNAIGNTHDTYTAAVASTSITGPNIPLPGNCTWDSTALTTIITSTTSTSYTTTTFSFVDDNSTATTLLPSVDSYFVGMPWSKVLFVAIFIFLILLTVVGNTLVILSVLTTRRLRTVTNCFVLNLAITDWLVGTCVMPPNVLLYIVGSWQFGWILCDIWISLDVLLCTASILSLCAISLDRYLAVTKPLTYSKNRRTKRLALFMIFIVWVTALSITCPPYLGWYEPGRRKEGNTVCRYNQNKGYVVFSAMGSFFIPLAVMLYVYLKIGFVLTSRRQRIVRDANSERTADHEIDCDNFLSESEHFQCGPQKFSFKSRWNIDPSSANNSKNNSLKCSKCNKNFVDQNSLKHQASFYELVEISRLSNQIATAHPPLTCNSVNCRYGDGTCTPTGTGTSISYTMADSQRGSTLPLQQLHCTDSRTSFSETCLAQALTQVGKYATNGQQQPSVMNNTQHPHQHSHSHPHHHHHAHHHRVPMRVSTTKRDTKTAKTLTMVMGGFIACWLPFFVYYLLIPFLPKAAVFEGLMSFLTWVGWVNCAINPFIYAFYNPDFRTAFWRLTCKRICKQKSPANHMAMFKG